MEKNSDAELQAMTTIWSAIEGLEPEARRRALQYVITRLNIAVADLLPPSNEPFTLQQPNSLQQEIPPPSSTDAPKDIRSFKEAKTPRSANEMAAVVAYFIKYESDERREWITTDDIRTYFHQAKYPIPAGNGRFTLQNAKQAGYFDMRSDGRYYLNAVGYNLVVHRLPATAGALPVATRSSTKKKMLKRPK